jgi:eight-cysteine-cluster-containing protein
MSSPFARAPAILSVWLLALVTCHDRRADTEAAGPAPAGSLATGRRADLPQAPGACRSDAGCMRTGCSGEVCSDREVATTCIWRSEYACYAEGFARCGCVGQSCAWAPDPELAACLRRTRGPDTSP